MFLTVLETRKSKSKMTVNLIPGMDFLPDWQMAFSLCAHINFSLGERERERQGVERIREMGGRLWGSFLVSHV
jgi:hypothetical protein